MLSVDTDNKYNILHVIQYSICESRSASNVIFECVKSIFFRQHFFTWYHLFTWEPFKIAKPTADKKTEIFLWSKSGRVANRIRMFKTATYSRKYMNTV
jgi:hypothetical protein